MAFSDTMDNATLDTMLLLLRVDIEEVTRKSKGKQKQGEVTDAEYALNVFKQDLTNMSAIVQDRVVAESMAAAVRHDGNLIEALCHQDHQLHSDRQMALRIAGRGSEAALPNVEYHDTKNNKPVTDVVLHDRNDLAEMKEEYMQVPTTNSLARSPEHKSNEDYVVAESSATAAKQLKGKAKAQPKITCVACDDPFDSPEIFCVPCQHNYCHTCLATLFNRSTFDESLFPPRCCKQEISLDHVRVFLDPDLVKTFEMKAIEFETQNRTYCFEPSCATFIPPNAINEGIATCPKCQRTTCTTCKNISHSGDCLMDQGLQMLLGMAEAQQWQRCYSCQSMVELNIGCNHITCRCKAQFCYVCGEKWKTCKCDHFNEDRLYARAAELVDRHPGRQLFQPPRLAHAQPGDSQDASSGTGSSNAREGRIARAIEHIREHHGCNHSSWDRVEGKHECEECGDTLLYFIFECDACHYQVCKRCKNNRL